jgi:XTP/dITP diphosphohydrolase
MEDVPDGERTARFVCVIAAVWPDGKEIIARGTCEGVILRIPGKDNGFGYDPVFYVPEEGTTFSEMPPDRKNEISHRANALKQFQIKLTEG